VPWIRLDTKLGPACCADHAGISGERFPRDEGGRQEATFVRDRAARGLRQEEVKRGRAGQKMVTEKAEARKARAIAGNGELSRRAGLEPSSPFATSSGHDSNHSPFGDCAQLIFGCFFFFFLCRPRRASSGGGDGAAGNGEFSRRIGALPHSIRLEGAEPAVVLEFRARFKPRRAF